MFGITSIWRVTRTILMRAQSFISVLIPTRNNGEDLLLCIESLRNLNYPKDRLQLLVFDNGSTDGTAERVREAYQRFHGEGWARLTLERIPQNLGAFGGRAEALKLLDPRTEFVLSLDDDVEVAPEALHLLVDAMDDPHAGVVGARIVYHDAPDQVASGAGYFNRWLGTYRERIPTVRTACDFVTSCGCLVRQTALQAVGGFDRDFFTSHGDVDLCLRLRAAGYQVLYEPDAVIYHKVARGGTRTPERVYYGYRNKFLLLRKHLPWWWRPTVFALYGALGLPKAFGISLAYHRGVREAELKSILLATLDAALDRRGEARWFLSASPSELASNLRQALDFTVRQVSSACVRIPYLLRVRPKGLLKLHLGCGNQRFEGYVNIDWRRTPATDVVCRVEKLPYPSDSAQLIETYHVIEHLPRHDAAKALREWHRVLAPGGMLIIECPDLDAAAREYLAGKQERLDSIFGHQRFPGDAHLFGYNFDRLKSLLEAAGFRRVEQKEARDYHAKQEPCIRVECVKDR